MKLLYTKLNHVLCEFHFAQILAGKGKKKIQFGHLMWNQVEKSAKSDF